MDTIDEINAQELEINDPHRGSHVEDMVDHYWGSINHVSTMIRASELKAGLILSFYGILLNLLYQGTDAVVNALILHKSLYIPLSIWSITTLTSIYYSINCFIPQIEEKFDRNVLFFGDIITKFGNASEYSKTFYKVSLNEKEIFHQMGEQIFVLSLIVSHKFQNVTKAIKYLAIGLFILFISSIYFIIITNI